MIKVLNLYAGIGGNRKLWKGVKVTAVELDPDIAAAYADFFPRDKVIVDDAHQYLLEHFNDFDFIWSSPPCQSHSSIRRNICVRFRGTKPVYPDMRLYQEIIFLQAHCEGLWVVENVKPYYKPLIDGVLLQRHLFWGNFDIPHKDFKQDNLRAIQIPELQQKTGFDLSDYKIKEKRQVLRNCIRPDLGAYILSCMKSAIREISNNGN